MQDTEQAPEREPADIFLWANNADAYKNELDVKITHLIAQGLLPN